MWSLRSSSKNSKRWQRQKTHLIPVYPPSFKVGIFSVGLQPLFGKEGKGRFLRPIRRELCCELLGQDLRSRYYGTQKSHECHSEPQAKNLTIAAPCKCEILRLPPQDDIATQPRAGKDEGGGISRKDTKAPREQFAQAYTRQ